MDETFGQSPLSRSSGGTVYRLHAEKKNIAVDLEMEGTKPPLIFGKDGTVEWENHVSAGYALTGLRMKGRMLSGGKSTTLSGVGRLEHSWSNSMGEDHDLYSVHLENNLQAVILHHHDEHGKGPLEGSVVNVSFPDGSQEAVSAYSLIPQGFWKSSVTGKTYPLGWVMEIPSKSMRFRLVPIVEDQECSGLGMTTWNGECDVEAEVDGTPLKGKGRAMLMGYKK